MKKRVDRLEYMGRNKKYLQVVLIEEGEPLPDGIGPDTVILVDDIPKSITIQDN